MPGGGGGGSHGQSHVRWHRVTVAVGCQPCGFKAPAGSTPGHPQEGYYRTCRHTWKISHSNREIPADSGDTSVESAMTDERHNSDYEMPAEPHHYQGITFFKSQWTLSPGYYEHIRQILHVLNGHGGGSRTTFQFSYHAARNHVMVTFRPGLKACMGWVTMR